MLASRQVLEGRSAQIAADFVDDINPGENERLITVDQTNQSVIVGERVVVKWLSPPASEPYSGGLLMQHLRVVGFERMPELYGLHVDDGMVLAIVMEYVPHSTDGWEWAVDDLLAELDGAVPTGTFIVDGKQLGEVVADLHRALACPSETIPRPLVEGPLTAWNAHAASLLAQATNVANREAREFVATCRPHAQRALDELTNVGSTLLQPVHGDLHVGQVLRSHGEVFLVDFDGDPIAGSAGGDTPIPRAPAAADVASLLQSIDHVGRIAIRRRGEDTTTIEQRVALAVDAALVAYRSRLESFGVGHLFDERLLGPMRVVQELHEIVYADKHLPRWMYVPIATLRSMFPASADELEVQVTSETKRIP